MRTALFDSGCLIWWSWVGWWGFDGWKRTKKVGGGDVRAEALSWDIEWEKAKNVFFGFLPLAPTVARCARHSHPSPPEEKVASRKKSRLRRKKTVPDAKMAHRVYQGWHVPTCE